MKVKPAKRLLIRVIWLVKFSLTNKKAFSKKAIFCRRQYGCTQWDVLISDTMQSQIREFFLGATAACGACLFTNPLEVVKIRMQLQGELQARGTFAVHYRNAFHAFFTIAKHDGFRSLQSGLCPALVYQAIMNGCRLGSYQVLNNLGFTRDEQNKLVFWKCVVAGAASGAVGAFFASPSYMVS